MVDDPAIMTPRQRRAEIAQLLARGYLRMIARQAKETPQSATGGNLTAVENLSESRPISLDVVRTPVPHVVETGTGGEAR